MSVAVTIFEKDNRLCIRSPFTLKELLSSIPGARWNFPKGTEAWSYPISPFTVHAIKSALGDDIKINIYDPHTGEIFRENYEEYLRLQLSQKLKSHESLPELPHGYKTFPPRKSQLQAFWFFREMRTGLAWMAPGAGKSRLICDLIEDRNHRNVLIISLKKAVENVWPYQFDQHLVKDEGVLFADDSGSVAKKFDLALQSYKYAQSIGERFLCVVSHSTVWRDPFAKLMKIVPFDFIVVDEIHKAGSISGKFSHFLAKFGTKPIHKLGLSGTAIPDKRLYVYSIFRFLDPGIFGTSFTKYKNNYFIMGGYQNYQIIGRLNQEEWEKKFWSITYYCDESDLDLPDEQHIERIFNLSKTSRGIYDRLDLKGIVEFEDGSVVTADNPMVKNIRLHQIASGYVSTSVDATRDQFLNRIVDVHQEKIEVLSEVLDEIGENEPIVIFYQFTKDLHNIEELLKKEKRTFSVLSGSQNELREWIKGETEIIIVQMQVGSESIDLTRSCFAIYYSFGYSLNQLMQSRRRIARPPQKRPCRYYYILAKATVDVSTIRTINKKDKDVQDLVSTYDKHIENEIFIDG